MLPRGSFVRFQHFVRLCCRHSTSHFAVSVVLSWVELKIYFQAQRRLILKNEPILYAPSPPASPLTPYPMRPHRWPLRNSVAALPACPFGAAGWVLGDPAQFADDCQSCCVALRPSSSLPECFRSFCSWTLPSALCSSSSFCGSLSLYRFIRSRCFLHFHCVNLFFKAESILLFSKKRQTPSH